MRDVIWEAMLDGQWRCEVQRLSESMGLLTVVSEDTDETLLSKEVPLAYGARFGPDVDDVEQWKVASEAAVDGREAA